MTPERIPDKWPCGAVESGWCNKPGCIMNGCVRRGWPPAPLKIVVEPEIGDRPNLDVEDRLISAFIVWAICPAPGPRGVKSNMPEHLRNYFDEYGRLAATTPRTTPTPREITLAEEALGWFGIFMRGDEGKAQRDKTELITVVILDKIVRGGRMDWPLIQARMKWWASNPDTIRKRYERAIEEMAGKLDMSAASV